MPKSNPKSNPAAKKVQKVKPSTPTVNENNIDQIEKETIERVNNTLSVLETAIASWEASDEKPVDLEPKFKKYKRIHNALVEWETNMLKSMGRYRDFDSRVHHLQEFVDICYTCA